MAESDPTWKIATKPSEGALVYLWKIIGARWSPRQLCRVGNANCERRQDLYYQWHEESCHKRAGAGVGVNTQEVRDQGHATASHLVAGQRVLVEYRHCTHDLGTLWLGRTVANQKWNGACVKSAKQACKEAKKKFVKVDKTRFDEKDYMVAVQWLELDGDNGLGQDYVMQSQTAYIFNSTELRLAGFGVQQTAGPVAYNSRERRGEQAGKMSQIMAAQKWLLPADVRLRAETACRGLLEDSE
mmetsp:Transcript_40156/g.79066  ORF Transcript_40156/g.79066 Transcript_40156/m.79066 type:complete len:242 (+) Transcript_40156:239-964(+)